MLEQQPLDLGDGNILPTADDNILLAARDADITIRIQPRQIAGIEPAIANDKGFRLFR
tara:strand:+ start:229 stop:402 length:174 start_codon:yes stop_codon:yes gene_type:complete